MCQENLALQKMKMMLILSPRATGAVGPALSWECLFVLGRDNVTLSSFLLGLSTVDPWRASQGTPFCALTKYCHRAVPQACEHLA